MNTSKNPETLTREMAKFLWIYLLFCTVPAMAFKVISPKNELTVGQNPVYFAWSSSISVAPEYNLVVSKNADLRDPLVNTSFTATNASVNIPGVAHNTRYYWRVTDKSLNISTDIVSFKYVVIDSVATLAAWYRADSGLTTNAGKVSQWNDLSGNAKNMIQGNGTLQPEFVDQEAILGNKPVVKFSGTPSVYMQSLSDISLTNFSVFVLRTHEAYPVFLQYFLGGFSQGLFSDGTGLGIGFGTFQGGVISASSISSLNPQFAVYLHDNRNIRLNNSNNLGATVNFAALNVNTLGARPDGLSFSYKGKIAEMIIFKAQLDDAQSQAVYNYLYDKYAPPVNLGDDIVGGSSFCDSVTITAESRFSSYLWTNGQTTASVKVPANGKYGVIVKDIFDRESYDEINVYPYRRLDDATVYICPGDTFEIDLKTPVGFSALWNTGATTTKLKVTESGRYTVKITDGRGCFVFDTINVVIDDPVLLPAPNAGVLTLCENEKLFAITSSVFDSIRWSTGSSSQFISVTSPGSYSVFGRTTVGCILNENFTVNISGKAPAADFSNSPFCENAPTLFTDVSVTPLGNEITSWKWSFGDGNTSTEEAPSNIYASIGTYTATLKVTTNAGCSDSIAKTVVVRKRPLADFYNLLSCSGNATTFIDNSIANSDSLAGWNWDFNGLGTSTQRNPRFSFPAATTYTTLLQVTNSFGCTDTAIRQTIVNPSPVADFKADTSCAGTNTVFTNLSTVQVPSVITNYLWEYGDESQSIQVSQPHLYPGYGEYNVRLSIRSSNQCVDTAEKVVRVFAKPDVDFSLSNTQCAGKEIRFQDNSTTPDGSALSNWQWFFSGQGTSTQQNPLFTFNEQGNYTIQLTARTTAGCAGTQFRSIAVTSPPVVNFSFTPNYGPPPLSVSYTNLSPSSGNYIWDYGDGSPTYLGFTPPPHTYTVRGTYPIKLLATDFKGCSDSLVRDILVDNAFVDGVMATVNVVPNGEYYKVVVTILNNSNIEVTSLGITIRLANGSEVRETWTGSLKPGNSVVYPFVGQLRYNANGDVPVICATIESVNVNAVENDLSNNTTCEEITVGQFDVLAVFPNPSSDNVNFGVMLPEDGEVEITLYDVLGKLLYAYTFDGVTGYNNLRMPVLPLNGSLYIAEVKYNDEVIRRKIMRTGRDN